MKGLHRISHDPAQGLAWLDEAAEQRDLASMNELGEIYRLGFNGVRRNLALSIVWHRKAADLGDRLSMFSLVSAYKFGWGGVQDAGEAARWHHLAEEQLQRDAENGDVVAQWWVGLECEYGTEGHDLDKHAALAWFRSAAQSTGIVKRLAEAEIARLADPPTSSPQDGYR